MNKNITGITMLVAALALLQGSPAKATVIAVVDSGTDVEHTELQQKIWQNPDATSGGTDAVTGYTDDVNGWNFAENSNVLLDRELIGTFPQDDYNFFALQTKALQGTATPAEIAWLKAKVKDDQFVQQLEKFGNFVHGTHVAGISSKDTADARIMTLRLIAGDKSVVNPMYTAFANALAAPPSLGSGNIGDVLIKMGLGYLAKQQGTGLAPISKYISEEHARVVNCSFGASRASIEPVIKPLIEKILGTQLTQAQLDDYADYFLGEAAKSMQDNFVSPAADALFVIAAGNDGTDNDVAPTAPANVRTDNAITVAATLGVSKLASFSNYGATKVDIAAPGVGILSTVPGNEHMQLSGTSQATPYITRVAGKVLDVNPKLKPADVKQILMQTVDKKSFLAGKVVSGGIANEGRAVRAARLTLTMPLDAAIHQANLQVADALEVLSTGKIDPAASQFVLPLPNFIH